MGDDTGFSYKICRIIKLSFRRFKFEGFWSKILEFKESMKEAYSNSTSICFESLLLLGNLKLPFKIQRAI